MNTHHTCLLIIICFTFNIYIAPIYSSELCRKLITQITVQHKDKKLIIFEPNGDKAINLNELFGDNDQVLLGISNTGHYYLNVGNTQIEGAPFPSLVNKVERKILDGYLIRFPNIQQKTIQAWKENMDKKKLFWGLSVSCTKTACLALKKGFNIKIANNTNHQILTLHTFLDILEKGFIDENGNPVRFEIYKTSQKTLDFGSLSKSLSEQDRDGIIRSALSITAIIAVPTVGFFVLVHGKQK